jgi:ribosomal-protein-alanine N-acetyltransferase
MTTGDLDAVLEIEADSFPTPWSRRHFLAELGAHRYARNLVLHGEEGVLGYACLWLVGRELRINNIAIRGSSRGRGLGRALLRFLLEDAAARGCREATLEVRPSNRAALALYRAHGFREVGRRPGYYQDTREEAILMAARIARR